MNQFYVYALVDPRSKEIFYIGKGKEKRYLQHVKDYLKSPSDKNDIINSIVSSNLEVEYLFIAEQLIENAAYILEEMLIERLGRRIINTGNLTNLEPGGRWQYPKLLLEENEKVKFEDVKLEYPELIPILDAYPKISKSYNRPLPWFEKKILKVNAVYQYSESGEYIATHDLSAMNFITEFHSMYIIKAINENEGYIYSSQWSLNKENRMRDLNAIDLVIFEKLKLFDKPSYIKISVSKIENENYRNRNQEVE